MMSLYFLARASDRVIGSRKWRLRLPLLGLFKCFLPAWRRFSLPVPVMRKRFLAPLCVFILGMANPCLRAAGPAALGVKTKRAPGSHQGSPRQSVRPLVPRREAL